MAGRATLISSVTSAIPAYHMMTIFLPKNLTSSLDSLNNRFLCSGNDQKMGHLVAWKDLSCPKRMGGLSLRRMELDNLALLKKNSVALCT